MSKNLYPTLTAIALVIALAGCGGGGEFDFADTLKATESIESKNAAVGASQSEEWQPAYVESAPTAAIGQQLPEVSAPEPAAAATSSSLVDGVALGVASGVAGAAAGAAAGAGAAAFVVPLSVPPVDLQ